MIIEKIYRKLPMNTGRVYQIVNSENKMVYVGSTKETLSRRMAEHRAASKCMNSYFHRSMREIGPEKFRISLLELVQYNSKDELRARELEWITRFNTMQNGYNRNAPIATPERSADLHRQNVARYYEQNKVNNRYACNICEFTTGSNYNLQTHLATNGHAQRVNQFYLDQLPIGLLEA